MITENNHPDERTAFMFIAMDDDKKAHVVYCHDESALKEAVRHSMFMDGELDDDELQQVEGVVKTLLEDGEMRFEGDAPLYFYRLAEARATTQQANKGDEPAACDCGVQCRDYGKEICRYHHDDAALGRLYREYFDQIHPEEVCKVVNARAAAPQAVTLSEVCEHEWSPITEPHKECDKCGEVRRDWGTETKAVTLSDEQSLRGWEIERTDSKPFKRITITAPNGHAAVVDSLARNPENILYMLADALLTAHPTEQRMSDAERDVLAERERASETGEAEGCTAADAAMLREANHSLAAENDRLRKALAPFARLVSTDRLSWAMVEYAVDGDPEKQTFQRPQMQRAFNRAAALLRENIPAGETINADALDLPEWVKNANPPTMAAQQTVSPTDDAEDAERYRWSRTKLKSHEVCGGVQFEMWFDAQDYDLDALIDAARKGDSQ